MQSQINARFASFLDANSSELKVGLGSMKDYLRRGKDEVAFDFDEEPSQEIIDFARGAVQMRAVSEHPYEKDIVKGFTRAMLEYAAKKPLIAVTWQDQSTGEVVLGRGINGWIWTPPHNVLIEYDETSKKAGDRVGKFSLVVAETMPLDNRLVIISVHTGDWSYCRQKYKEGVDIAIYDSLVNEEYHPHQFQWYLERFGASGLQSKTILTHFSGFADVGLDFNTVAVKTDNAEAIPVFGTFCEIIDPSQWHMWEARGYYNDGMLSDGDGRYASKVAHKHLEGVKLKDIRAIMPAQIHKFKESLEAKGYMF